jgi:hypothetical protein
MTMRRARPEDQIQRAVFDHLRVRSAPATYAFAVPNGGLRPRVEAAIMAGLGLHAGTPDIVIIRDGHAYALELKAPGGRLSEAQISAQEALRAAGAAVATCYGLDAAIKQLEDWQLLRGRTQ